MRYLLTGLFVVSFLCLGSIAFGAEPDWTNPSSLDVFDQATAAFLEVDTEALFDQAWQAYQDGDFELAAQNYMALLRFDTEDNNTLYNLAGCLSLLGEAELASRYLEYAVNAGYKDFYWLGQDPDFDPVRESEVFVDTMSRLEAELAVKEAELGDIVYFEALVKLRARVHYPAEYDPTKTYPLMIGLHGFGSYPDRFINLHKRLADEEFIYLSPQGPYPFISSLGSVGYSWGGWIEGEELPRGSWRLSEDYVSSLIEQATNHYNVNKVYLMGFSQGAAMTLTAGIHNHELLDGLIAFGGWLDTSRVSDDDLARAVDHLKIVIAHGNEDTMVEFQSALDAVDKLEAAGLDYYFHEFDGAHAVPEEALQAAWLWLNQSEPTESDSSVED